jgi:hypothetical protein
MEMISFGVRTNPPNLAQVISDLPRSVRGPATEAAAIYLVGNSSRGLSHYPGYAYISRASAYGSSFFSDKQRRYVMAKIRSGEIQPGYPHRTGRLQRGWSIIQSGAATRVINAEPYAVYVVGDPGQSRHEEKAGWRRIGLIVASNEKGMIQAADRAAQDIIKALGL